MSVQKHKKIGFFLALVMLLGSVVGIGIFFKNASVSRATNGEGLSWLLAWIFGGLISLAAAINFAEIGSFKNTKIAGISNWAYKISGKRLGYFANLSYLIFYWGMLFTVLGSFGSEAFFYFLSLVSDLKFGDIKIWVHILVGIVFSSSLIILNLLSTKAAGMFQAVVTIVKFLPLVAAMLIGLIFANTHNTKDGLNAFFTSKSVTIKGVMVALPAVLFAYDAFLVTGSLGNKLKNSQKNLPKVVFLGMLIVVVLYSLIAVSSILHNNGTIGGLLSDSLPTKVQKYVSPIIFAFILISTLGVINGISGAFWNELNNSINANLLFGSKKIKEKLGLTKTTLLYLFIIWSFWGFIIYIPSITLNSDILLDGFSNYPTTFFFGFYALLIAIYSFKRKKIQETKKINSIIFYTASLISILGIIAVEIAYLTNIILFMAQNETNPNKWGLFADNNSNLFVSYVPYLLYLITLSLFFGLPYLNLGLEKAIFKRCIIKDFEESIQKNENE